MGNSKLNKLGCISVGTRLDVFLRLIISSSIFFVFKKKNVNFFRSIQKLILWPSEYFDLLSLLLYSNPLFMNTKCFDLSAYWNSLNFKGVLYYIFKISGMSCWLIIFINIKYKKNKYSKVNKVISQEVLFKSMAWAEREVSELFGLFFFFKSNNRKLITDYFFKIYPLLNWVPSVGFSELYLSAEGFFFNRSIKIFNSTLA